MKTPNGVLPPFETPLSGYACAGYTFANDPHRRALLRGVIGEGNRNFGATYALADHVTTDKCIVPVLWQFVLAGMDTRDRLSRLRFSAIRALISTHRKCCEVANPTVCDWSIPMSELYSILPDIISNIVSEVVAGVILSIISYVFISERR